MDGDADRRVRVALFGLFAERGRLPPRAEVAAAAGVGVEDVGPAYRRLADDHVIVLEPGSDEPWMVNPFSAVPTPYDVRVEDRHFWGNCIWDALGIVAMLGGTGSVRTSCPDCGEPLGVDVRDGRLHHDDDLVVHFAVPAAHWWDDIGFT